MPHCHCALRLVQARQSQRPTITPIIASSQALLAMTVVKGVQREIPLAGVWGCPPSFKKSPKIGGHRGLIESISAVSNGFEGIIRSICNVDVA
jgi:hypothetical protein